MNRISEDVSKVRMYYGPVLMYGTNAIILFIVIILYMFSVAPKLTIYSLIPLPILSIFIYKISDLINKKSTKVQESLSDLSTYSQESFSGISVLKSFNIQDLIFGKFDKYALESFKNNLSLAKIQAWFFPIILFLIGLSNLIVISSGDIFIGDKNLKSLKLSELRKIISYVPQNNFLFSESIQRNIQFGNPKATKDQVQKAAVLSEIDHEILKFEKGYETILGERGVTLSGGQVQRLSIARSFIKDSDIYLFDDCFSSLDSDTEDRIITNLKNNFNNKTLLIVSHRVSCVRHADKIIVLENGKIVQKGTHNELISKEGFYKELNAKQNSEVNK